MSYPGKISGTNLDYIPGIAVSASGDVYIQARIPNTSIPLLCPTCEFAENAENAENWAVYRKTNVKNEFEFVAMGKQETYQGKKYYEYYRQFDFTFSMLGEIASASTAPWVVKSVDVAKKEVTFDTSVWPKNTGNLALSDVATGDFFGQNIEFAPESNDPCPGLACKNAQALSVVRQRTAFTGATAYFIGRASLLYNESWNLLWKKSIENTTIFRIRENGAKDVVGKDVAAFFAKSSDLPLVNNFVYSRVDGRFYVLAYPASYPWTLYRVSEDALVP